ncbi:MAG: nucleoside kinase [Clostridia bacterium]|nr:nucleoside kinase [Clostridia bacterium]
MQSIVNSYRRYALTLDKINRLAYKDPKEFVLIAENAFRSDIKEIAKGILNSPNRCKVVMLAGPSASGKTTTAYILREELLNLGCGSEIISMDNFYLGEENVPRTSDNRPDFETVYALNIPLIEKCISELLQFGEYEIAQFDFAASRPKEETKKINLHNDSIAIIEGIHALNPLFTEHIKSAAGLKKIYISVKQGIRASNNSGYLLTAAELRLFRRLVRDHKFRGSCAQHTLGMWDNVLYGEKRYIVPFKYSGDITINSIHIYEPCITAAEAVPILKEVSQNDKEYVYANYLIERAEKFVRIPEKYVPENSLMREFLGNGKYNL